MRNRNTNEKGESWTKHEKDQVWEKGIILPDNDAKNWRYDKYGMMMEYTAFGNTGSQYGWEIDHIQSVSEGGKDNTENLQPLNWVNNLEKDHHLNPGQ